MEVGTNEPLSRNRLEIPNSCGSSLPRKTKNQAREKKEGFSFLPPIPPLLLPPFLPPSSFPLIIPYLLPPYNPPYNIPPFYPHHIFY
jgi:hypothetical protein